MAYSFEENTQSVFGLKCGTTQYTQLAYKTAHDIQCAKQQSNALHLPCPVLQCPALPCTALPKITLWLAGSR